VDGSGSIYRNANFLGGFGDHPALAHWRDLNLLVIVAAFFYLRSMLRDSTKRSPATKFSRFFPVHTQPTPEYSLSLLEGSRLGNRAPGRRDAVLVRATPDTRIMDNACVMPIQLFYFLTSVTCVQLDVNILEAPKVGDQLPSYLLNGGTCDGRRTIDTERTF
jgi:hypothetical protein